MSADTTGTPDKPFGYCLNTSTIKGQELSLEEEIAIAAEAGYDGIEPWIRELDSYVEGGGDLEELGRQVAGEGLEVPNLIGFFEWASDDDEVRKRGFEEARRNLDMAQKVGCRQLAAPPFGIVDKPGLSLDRMAERYLHLLEIAEDFGVVPIVEFWGVSQSLGKFSEAVYVAVQSGHRNARVLADVFHMYKSGTGHNALRLIGPETLGLFHLNDYPAEPPLETIADKHRVYPGDGIAPLDQIFQDIYRGGYRGMLSLELFNESYWQQDAREVARTGLEKLQGAVARALA